MVQARSCSPTCRRRRRNGVLDMTERLQTNGTFGSGQRARAAITESDLSHRNRFNDLCVISMRGTKAYDKRTALQQWSEQLKRAEAQRSRALSQMFLRSSLPLVRSMSMSVGAHKSVSSVLTRLHSRGCVW